MLVSIGGWALGMRAMMVTTQGEDYINFAEAKGLLPRTIFLHYAIRNAMLPQVTALALVLGPDPLGRGAGRGDVRLPWHRHGAVPGDRGSDFFLVQGIVFVVIISIGVSTLDPGSDLSAARSAHHVPEGLR